MTKRSRLLALVAALAFANAAAAQEENPDYRIKAQFRDETGESVGNANFLVKSRFMQVYYGGVSRSDEFRFKIELDHSQYANRSFDVFLEDFSIGTITANSNGFFDQTYRSDFKPDDAPDLPLPAGFPDFVDAGDVVTLLDPSTQAVVLTSIFGEEFKRGDVDQDNDVDDDDLDVWSRSFGAAGLGPANGDFSGDNRSEGRDFLVWQTNASFGNSSGAAGVPEPSALGLAAAAALVAGARKRRR